MFESLLVANRGEIARRVLRTAHAMGLRTIAVHSDADAHLPFVHEADEAVLVGGSQPEDPEVAIARLIEAARRTGAEAVHPGSGLLAQSPELARAVLDAGLAWVGPPPEVMAAMVDPAEARRLITGAGVQTASLGSNRPFGPRSRLVDVQLLGLPGGRVVAVGDRDRSLGADGRELIVESPSPGLTDDLRRRLLAAAVLAGEAAGGRNACTVELVVDPVSGDYGVLGLRAELSLAHPVIELVTGVDLVEEQLRVAAGDESAADLNDLRHDGHAIGVGVYSESVADAQGSAGEISVWVEPAGDGVRVDAGYAEGSAVTGSDPLAVLTVWAPDRPSALERTRAAVREFRIEGVATNLGRVDTLLEDQGRGESPTTPSSSRG